MKQEDERVEELDLDAIRKRHSRREAEYIEAEDDPTMPVRLWGDPRPQEHHDRGALLAEIERLRAALRRAGSTGTVVEGWIDHDEPPEEGTWVGFWNVPESEMGDRYARATLIIRSPSDGE